MGGVFGILDSKKRPINNQLKRIGESLRLHTWTRIQTWSNEQQGVGMGQANIGIFSADEQPLKNKDKTISIVFFGELFYAESIRIALNSEGYNIKKNDDARIVLYLYEKKGETFIHDLEGVFVFAILDEGKGLLIIGNDRFGLIPTYYAHYNAKFVFGPAVKTILTDNQFQKKIDLTSLAQFIRFQRLLGTRTHFEGIHMLDYGSVLKYDYKNNVLSTYHYWDFNRIPKWNPGISFDETVSETGRLLRRSIRERTQKGHKVGVYLSGGLDSRTVLALASKIKPPIVSLTYGLPNCRDVHYAKRIVRKIRSPHLYIPQMNGKWIQEEVKFHLEITEGFTTWLHAHAGPTFNKARDIMEVNLSGFNGDGLMGARWSGIAPLVIEAVDDLDFISRIYQHWNQDFCWPGITEAEEKLLFREDIYRQINNRAFQSLILELEKLSGFKYDSMFDYWQEISQGIRLSNFNLIYQREYIESRYPFCDYRLTEFIHSMPLEYRLNNKLYKKVINTEIPEVAWIPWDKDEIILKNIKSLIFLNKLIVNLRRHIGKYHRFEIWFDPEGWLRRDLKKWAEELLFDSRTLDRGIFSVDFLKSIFKRHMSGTEIHTIGKIAPIITYEMMLRRFYDQ